MDEFIAGKSYVLNPGDDYLYNVKYPDYLTFTGNLGISDDNNEISLIIWPSLTGEDEYGVRIAVDNETFEIMVDKNMKPKNGENDDIINKYNEEIQVLFQKADETWGIME